MNGPPQKPTTAFSAGSSRTHEPHRLEHVRERFLGIGAQTLDVRARCASAASIDRPDAFDELDVDAHRDDRGHDVGEHHGRVDAVPAHRLEGHLGAELRRAGELEERVPLADARGTRAASGPPGA